MKEDYLWTEKYRPTTIEDCILPSRIKTVMGEYIKSGSLPNLILTGTPGCGKGSLINALTHELSADVLFLNCGSEGRIDVLRNQITNFASTVSLLDDSPSKKIVVLDELDAVSGGSNFMPALKAFIEEFSSNALFILTANDSHKIIPALKSRCIEVDYKKEISKKETPDLMRQFLKRVCGILDKEEVTYDKRVVAALIKRSFPDFRKTINNLQSYSVSGEIDTGALIETGDDLSVLVDLVKEKKFGEIREFIDGMNSVEVFTELFNLLLLELDNSSVPQMVVLLNEYQYKAAFVANPRINLLAFLTEIMVEGEFRK